MLSHHIIMSDLYFTGVYVLLFCNVCNLHCTDIYICAIVLVAELHIWGRIL